MKIVKILFIYKIEYASSFNSSVFADLEERIEYRIREYIIIYRVPYFAGERNEAWIKIRGHGHGDILWE